MKQRVISAMLGLCLLAVVLLLGDTAILNVCVAFLSVLAIYELFAVCRYTSRALMAVCFLFAATVPFMRFAFLSEYIMPICFLFVAGLFMLMLAFHKTLPVEQIAFGFFVSVVIPAAFSSIIYIRDMAANVQLGTLYVLICLGSAWLTDTGAFFVGTVFGRHKLAPEISPKKTIEGVAGGVLLNMVGLAAIAAVYSRAALGLSDVHIAVNYLELVVMAPFASALAIMGDLCASIIKRHCNVKDFGNIMPGHGGVLDRFDSVLLAAPFVFVYTRFFGIFTIS